MKGPDPRLGSRWPPASRAQARSRPQRQSSAPGRDAPGPQASARHRFHPRRADPQPHGQLPQDGLPRGSPQAGPAPLPPRAASAPGSASPPLQTERPPGISTPVRAPHTSAGSRAALPRSRRSHPYLRAARPSPDPRGGRRPAPGSHVPRGPGRRETARVRGTLTLDGALAGGVGRQQQHLAPLLGGHR